MLRVAQRALLAIPALAIISAFVLLGGERPALAGVTLTPTRFDDPAPDGCQPGDCSLREALISANNNPGQDSITLPPGTYTLSIQGQGENAAATGDLDITGDLSITGDGPASTIIDGGAAQDTIFQILPGAAASISGIAIRNANPGGGYAGGLDNGGSLNLSDCAITDNTASANGGGAWNDGTMTLDMCTVSGNVADGNGGGLYNRNGALTISNSTISNNTADPFEGGGIYNNNGTVAIDDSVITGNSAVTNGGAVGSDHSLTISDSTIAGNEAGEDGGGIYNYATMTLERSTVAGNTAGVQGGGIVDAGVAVLTNVTVSGNSVPGNGTGGVYNPNDDLTITNSTITGNSATHTGGFRSLSTATIKNTIVANNIGPDCSGNVGSITSAGHNLDSDNTCDLTAGGDLPGVNPMLGPLADNGGPTGTHALLEGSPAINAGDGGACPATDQRGFTRVGICDVGAYESDGIPLELKQGDVNCDDQVTAVDALFILRDVAQIPPPAGCLDLAGDVNCDGAKTAVDALGVLRFVAGLPVNQNDPCADIGTPV